MPPATPAVFFSYSREDSAFALRLAQDLKAAGANVWIDQVDIEPGQEWDSAIEAAVTQSPRILLILSPSSVTSRNVRNEISFALDENKTIIPVLYQDCTVPLQLRRVQYIDLKSDYSHGFSVLLRALGAEQRGPVGAKPVIVEPNALRVDQELKKGVEQDRLEQEHKRAEEQAKLENEGRKVAKRARLEAEHKRSAKQDRLEQERKQTAKRARGEAERRKAHEQRLRELRPKAATEGARIEEQKESQETCQAALERQHVAAEPRRKRELDNREKAGSSNTKFTAPRPIFPIISLTGTADFSCIIFAPEGGTAASGSENTVCLWRVSDGKLVTTFEGHNEEVDCAAFSLDGTMLAAGSTQDDRVCLWRVSDGKLLSTVKQDMVQCVSFSPDGAMLSSGSAHGDVRLWRVSEGKLKHVRRLKGHAKEVNDVAFSPNSATLASASDDKLVRLWHVLDGDLLGTLEGHTQWVKCVTFSPDGTMLASGTQVLISTPEIELWRISDGKLKHLRSLEGQSATINSVAFSPEGGVLASGAKDGSICLWRVRDGKLLHTLEQTAAVQRVAFSGDGTTLLAAAKDKTVRRWRLK